MRLSVVVEPGPSARSSSSLAGAPCHVGEPWSHAHAHAHVASAAASAAALCLSVCKVWVSTRRGGRRYEGRGDLLARAASYAGWWRGEVPELVQRGVDEAVRDGLGHEVRDRPLHEARVRDEQLVHEPPLVHVAAAQLQLGHLRGPVRYREI